MPVFGLKEREKVAVFIDGPNTHQSAKANDTDIDFKKLVNIFKRECDLRHMFYYTPVQGEGHGQDDNPLKPLLDMLAYNGYSLTVKQAKHQGRSKPTVEMALDAIQLAEHLDHVVLFTGDGDFTRLVRDLKMRFGVAVTVVSTLTNENYVADELRREANRFIELKDIRESIRRANAARSGASKA